MKTTVAGAMSSLQMQIDNCVKSENKEWETKARARLKQITRDFLPSGSGIDNGTFVREIDDTKIVMECGFHHMNEHGSYDGWTTHRVTARCGFYLGITIAVTNGRRNEIGEYLAETYRHALSREIEWSEETQRYVECAA